MLNHNQKERLMKNWGEKADSLACLAEVRVYDPLSSWQCFIYAINPNDENEVMCLISGGKNLEPITTNWTLKEIGMLYNSYGNGAQVDLEFRPRQVEIIYKKLKEACEWIQ